MFNVKDAAFTKLLGAYPQSFDAGAMRPTYLGAWEDLPDAVVSRTVDWFVKNWQRCPTLNEFMAEAQNEQRSQRRINQKQNMANCQKCWVEVDTSKDTWKPCDTCLPDTFEQWREGAYQKSW